MYAQWPWSRFGIHFHKSQEKLIYKFSRFRGWKNGRLLGQLQKGRNFSCCIPSLQESDCTPPHTPKNKKKQWSIAAIFWLEMPNPIIQALTENDELFSTVQCFSSRYFLCKVEFHSLVPAVQTFAAKIGHAVLHWG